MKKQQSSIQQATTITTAGSNKYVYSFDEGNKDMKMLLGGKGAGLAEMTKIGIPVPPGFTITTEVCELYNKNNKKYPSEVDSQVREKLAQLESKVGAKFGDKDNPLLVSVRSGAAVSMPGMMDTVLNLGLNDETVKGIIKNTQNERFAYDAYRRFIQMFGDVVLEVEHNKFEHALQHIKDAKKVHNDTDLDANDLKQLVSDYKKIVKEETGKEFPTDVHEQLQLSINAVFGSWQNPRAIAYRKINDIKGLIGTAVNVQAMVFGNMGEDSGTGVAFTRDPSTGEKIFYGEFLRNAQGEDVVAGIRTPQPIKELANAWPEVYKQLVGVYKTLESHYKDMQDIEFTIQRGKLYLLQTRNGKRTAQAAIRIAVEMLDEKLIDEKTAVMRVQPQQLDQLLHKQLDPIAKKDAQKTGKVLAKGLPASPGAAVGQAVFDAAKAHAWAKEGKKVILVRTETSPEDIEGMHASQGILTSRGGMTSHAAVVGRGMGKCCVVGCNEIKVNEAQCIFTVTIPAIGSKQSLQHTIKEGDFITLDGATGEVFVGKLNVVEPELTSHFAKLMESADKIRRLKVRTNADIPRDSEVARKFGAEGIGLCRTEHMFFEADRIRAMREMILADNLEGRKKALAKLLPMQTSDFVGLFRVMKGYPVTIRLIDPPLHEFLPQDEEEIKAIAQEIDVSIAKLKEKISSLHETNPMLGHRGCRLTISYPEIAEMQTEAIISAAAKVIKEGQSIIPEIMIPLVGHVNELKYMREVVDKKAQEIVAREKVDMEYKIGTMIEVPRGALTADEVAEHADFFSFGTNDLTQMTFGFSRDDVGKFIPEYIEKNLLEKDPFEVLDQTGVGQLIKIAVEKGRKTKHGLKIGICGEHGGEPSSVEFCHKLGLDYVSCSPYRVPIARLAAAHAVLKESK
ncbi:pyruvate, phosphate dikinase [Candidatus Woesearchaeota archaeon]|nr:pyruvate, phosphate dikinase [Candidatus Woesearchaeota archaeon]